MTPLGLYLHLPFCRVRCTYCPFAVSTDHALEDRYVDALLREIGQQASGERPIDTLYFGGGTPSRMKGVNLARTFATLREHFAIADGCEITLEANPEDIDREALAGWSELGINRLSIGIQSFHDNELLPLGRVHGREGALRAIELVRSSPFRVSLDLIAGLPGQSFESFGSSLESALGSGAGHLSVYLLDLEEGTMLARQVSKGSARLPDENLVRDLYLQAVPAAAARGIAQYEISNFARPGEESRHNRRYWSRSEYLGFGVGAHSFTRDRRRGNARDVPRYIELVLAGKSPVEFEEELGPGEIRREKIFLGLRQVSGLLYDDLSELCGKEGQAWARDGLHEGWLVERDGAVAFSPEGFLVSNELISRLF